MAVTRHPVGQVRLEQKADLKLEHPGRIDVRQARQRVRGLAAATTCPNVVFTAAVSP